MKKKRKIDQRNDKAMQLILKRLTEQLYYLI